MDREKIITFHNFITLLYLWKEQQSQSMSALSVFLLVLFFIMVAESDFSWIRDELVEIVSEWGEFLVCAQKWQGKK